MDRMVQLHDLKSETKRNEILYRHVKIMDPIGEGLIIFGSGSSNDELISRRQISQDSSMSRTEGSGDILPTQGLPPQSGPGPPFHHIFRQVYDQPRCDTLYTCRIHGMWLFAFLSNHHHWLLIISSHFTSLHLLAFIVGEATGYLARLDTLPVVNRRCND